MNYLQSLLSLKKNQDFDYSLLLYLLYLLDLEKEISITGNVVNNLLIDHYYSFYLSGIAPEGSLVFPMTLIPVRNKDNFIFEFRSLDFIEDFENDVKIDNLLQGLMSGLDPTV